MTGYRVTFERIGRNHNAPALVTEAESDAELGRLIWRYARRWILSRSFSVATDISAGTGYLLAGGLRPAGDFKIERVKVRAPCRICTREIRGRRTINGLRMATHNNYSRNRCPGSGQPIEVTLDT